MFDNVDSFVRLSRDAGSYEFGSNRGISHEASYAQSSFSSLN
jgi:hypothetical protein